MTDGKTSSGAPFKVPPAGIWNDMIDAGIEFGKRRRVGGQSDIGEPSLGIVKVKNNTGSQLSLGQLVEIGAPILTDIRRNQLWFLGETPDDTTYRLPAVLLAALPEDDIGDAQHSGWCIALVNMTVSGHQAAEIEYPNPNLISSAFGPFRIIYAPSGTGVKTCVVEMPARHGGGVVLRLISAMTAASDSGGDRTPGSGTADVYRIDSGGVLAAVTGMSDVNVLNMTVQTGSDGDWGQGKLDIFGKCWWDVADCPV